MNGTWKGIAGLLAGLLVAMIGGYFAIGADGATTADIRSAKTELEQECKDRTTGAMSNCQEKHADHKARLKELEDESAENERFHQEVADDIESINGRLDHMQRDLEEAPAKTAAEVVRALEARDR